MNCQQTRELIHLELSGELDSERRYQLQAHLPQCASCDHYFRTMSRMVSHMQSMDKILPPAGLVDRILTDSKTDKHNLTSSSTGLWLSALAATIMLALSWTLVPLVLPPKEQAINQNATVSDSSPQQINLLVNSERMLDKVRFSVQLPDKVFLTGYGESRQIQWNGTLKKGQNLLRLPINSQAAEASVLIFKIQHDNAVREIKVVVNGQT